MKLNARELREVDEGTVQEKLKTINRRPIYFLLENIYDTYNVGGLFRLADALSIEKLYLCGETETPPNSKIKKASIGTYKVVPWEYCQTVKQAVSNIRKQLTVNSKQLTVVAVEQSPKSAVYTKIEYSEPLAIILGNETYGVLPETLELADHIAEIPMWGINKSLNVIVSAAIVSYHAVGQLQNREE